MNKNAQYIVKITSKDGIIGSGFLHLPLDSEYACVFTAKHCIYGEKFDNQAVITDITFFFSDSTCENEASYTLTEHDFLIADSIEKNDIALLLIPKTELPSWLDQPNAPQLFKRMNKEEKCFINGFPKAKDNEYKRTLGECRFKTDQDNITQFQIEVSDILVQQYNTNNLVQGYSGSGIFMDIEDIVYVCGVVSDYEDTTKRFLCIDFASLQPLLTAQNLPTLQLQTIETDAQVLKDIKIIEANTKRILHNRITDKIGTIHLERSIVKDDLTMVIRAQALTIVTGDAGIGKSALTKNVLLSLQDDFHIIALLGEQLDKSSITSIFKTDDLAIENTFETILASAKYDKPKIILIDSIEKVLESNNATTIIDFLALLNQNTDVKIVITCRTYARIQFTIRFFSNIPQNKPFSIPFLIDNELGEIANIYPFLRPLLSNSKLEKILQIPFNLEKAVSIQNNGISNLIHFRQLMWEYIIEGIKNESIKRQYRAKTFLDIVLKRAKTMTTFVKINSPNSEIIECLNKDNIIEFHPYNKLLYTPVHDIYEDWGLIRYIDTQFNEWLESENHNDILCFFDNIGTSPAIRRTFRFWIIEQIDINKHLKNFIKNAVRNINIKQHWQDETLIAIIESDSLHIFLSENIKLLLIDNFSLFKRFNLLLRILSSTQNNEDSQAQNYSLNPIDNARRTMIDFLYENRNKLNEHYSTMVIPFLLDWGKEIDVNKSLPKEAKNAALLILDFFKTIEKKESYFNSSQKVNIEKTIHLLFNLTEVVQAEITELLEKTLAQPKNLRHELGGKLIKIVLSWAYSRQVCKYLPDLVIKIAEKKWFYFKPTKEEWKKRHEGMLSYHLPQRLERDEQFGVKNRYDSSYSPASGYQTPISHLLDYHTEKALVFIVKLFNHSIQSLKKASLSEKNGYELEADKLAEISIVIDSKKYIQFGSDALWSMYRGTGVVTPYLLQSVLMALENYILKLPKIIQKDNQEEFNLIQVEIHKIYDYLLENSQSVATSAVLVSFATAYPNFVGRKILPLLKVKEFYKWDLDRRSHEISTLSKHDMLYFNDPKYLQEERKQSDKLEHRQKSLEDYVFNAGFNSPFRGEIFQILDDFNAENSTDKLWLLKLNRMDCRKLEVIGKTEEGFIVQAKIDDNVKGFVEANNQTRSLDAPVFRIANWSRERYKREQNETDSFEEWEQNYEIIANLTFQHYFSTPVTLAAISIKDYFEQLNNAQKKWCINQVIGFVKNEIAKKREDNDSFDLSNRHNPFEDEPAFTIIVELAIKAKGEVKKVAKSLVFQSLMFLYSDNYRYPFLNKFREYVWDKDFDFGMACIAGLQEYSTLLTSNKRIHHFHPQNEQQEKEHIIRLKKYESEIDLIISKVVQNKCTINLQVIEIEKQSVFHFGQSIAIIPFDTTSKDLRKFIRCILAMIFENLPNEQRYSNDKIHHETLTTFKSFFAYYLLYQEEQEVVDFLKLLTDWTYTIKSDDFKLLYNNIEFIEKILDNIISYVDKQDSLISNFWIIWTELLCKMQNYQRPLFQENLLLFNPYWKGDATDWKPINDKKYFFEEVIQLRPSIEATGQLLSGIGFTELMPEGINWYVEAIKETSDNLGKGKKQDYTEKLVRDVFYTAHVRNQVRNDKTLRENYIFLLDKLIDLGSAQAFHIREDFISSRL